MAAYVGFDDSNSKVGDESFNLAQAFGVPLLYSSTPFPNVMRLEAHKRDIPAALVDLGMLEGKLEDLPDRYTIIKAPSFGEFLHSPSSGYLRSNASIGDTVKKGDILGEIVDVFGRKLVSVKSPLDGIILIVRTIFSIRLMEENNLGISTP